MAESDKLEWGKFVESDPQEYNPQNEEPADMGELDYDYSSFEEKIKAGLSEKDKGNQLFACGEYEAAWKQYDRCFVHVYTSKEEWSAIAQEGRDAINNFKLPCHLNRGLCRLRKDDLTNALWDFSEALRIDPSNAKGLYRRGVTLTRMIRADLAKEGTDQIWDLDIAEQRADDARKDLLEAVKIAPGDVSVRKAIDELKETKEALASHRKNYRADQRKLYSTFISNLDKDNQRIRQTEEKTVFEDMPKLERIRIE